MMNDAFSNASEGAARPVNRRQSGGKRSQQTQAVQAESRYTAAYPRLRAAVVWSELLAPPLAKRKRR